MRRLLTVREDGAELDTDASGSSLTIMKRSLPQPEQHQLTWSNLDSHVSACADSLRSQSFKLPWETGLEEWW